MNNLFLTSNDLEKIKLLSLLQNHYSGSLIAEQSATNDDKRLSVFFGNSGSNIRFHFNDDISWKAWSHSCGVVGCGEMKRGKKHLPNDVVSAINEFDESVTYETN